MQECLCCSVRSRSEPWIWEPALQSSSTTLRTESTVSGKWRSVSLPHWEAVPDVKISRPITRILIWFGKLPAGMTCPDQCVLGMCKRIEGRKYRQRGLISDLAKPFCLQSAPLCKEQLSFQVKVRQLMVQSSLPTGLTLSDSLYQSPYVTAARVSF